VAVDHLEVEAAQHDIDIIYPGAAAERTTTWARFCRSDRDNAGCDQSLAPLPEGAVWP
jgi:hypothetical protein